MFPAEKHEYSSGAWQQICSDPFTEATRATLSRLHSFTNENQKLSKVCQIFCLSECNVQRALQTCQTFRFRKLGVNLTQSPSLPSLQFSELVPIKHTRLSQCIYLLRIKKKTPAFQITLLSEYQSNDIETVLFYFRYVKLGSVLCPGLIGHSFPVDIEDFCK